MGKVVAHMHEVRNLLNSKGYDVVDLGLITTGESSYGTHLEDDQKVAVVDKDHKMNNFTYAEILSL